MNLLYLPSKSRVRVLEKGTKIEPKSHRKFDENGVGIFIDFGMILAPIGVHFGPILAPKIDQKSRSIFEGKRGWTTEGSGGRGGAQEVFFFAQRLILDKEID